MQSNLGKWVAGFLAVVLIVSGSLLGSFGGTQLDGELPSSSSFKPLGRRALYETLARLDFPIERWRRPPSSLPRDGALLFLLDVPQPAIGARGEDSPSNSPFANTPESSSLNLHLPVHYGRFLDEGGVIVASCDRKMRDFFVELFRQYF